MTLRGITHTGVLQSPGPAATKEFQVGLISVGIRNTHFTGRDLLLFQLSEALEHKQNQQSTPIVVVHGISGIGKSQLALEYVHRFSAGYDGIFWLDGSSEVALLRSIERSLLLVQAHYEEHGLADHNSWYDAIVKALQKPAINDTGTKSAKIDAEVEQRFGKATTNYRNPPQKDIFLRWLARNTNRAWLIIFDNVDGLETFDVRHFIPVTRWGAVLSTSRRSDLGPYFKAFEVTEMSTEDSLALLRATSKIQFDVQTKGKRSHQLNYWI